MDVEAVYDELGISLKRSGNVWKGACPFHAENDPSFTVYSDGSFYCFGCQKGGSLYKLKKELFIDPEDEVVAFPRKPENIKENALLDLHSIKKQQDSELFLLLEDHPYKKKVGAWSEFDHLWTDVRCLESSSDTDLVDLVMMIRTRFYNIKNSLKKNLNL